jgi:hypothetical protein
MVRSRCIRSGNLCQGNKSIGRRSNARCSSGTRSLGSCRRSGTGCCSGACPHAEGFQHEQHGTGSRWWSGDGLGQHAHECLPLPRLSVLRQNERREVHDGGASQSRRCACGSRQGLRAIVNRFQNCISTAAPLSGSSAERLSGRFSGPERKWAAASIGMRLFPAQATDWLTTLGQGASASHRV